MNSDQFTGLGFSQRLRLLDILDQITQVSLSGADMQSVLKGVLDLVLEIFHADRAWFLYPCDPDAPSWGVPMESNRPKWPGLFLLGKEVPMDADIARTFREMLDTDKTIQYIPGSDHPVPPNIALQFSVKSQLMIALRPNIGSPWLFGLHHCESAVKHDDEELTVFTAIAHRIADTLSVLITTRQLRENEIKFRTLYNSTSDAVMLLSGDIFIDGNKAALAILGCTTIDDFVSKRPADFSPSRQPCGTDSGILAGKHIAIAQQRGGHRFEWIHKRCDNGAEFATEVLLSPMELNGKAILQATVRDISERKRAEAELLSLMAESQQAEKELRGHQQLLREMAAQDVTRREMDFKHIAREVHDELGQTLTALRMDISLLRMQFGALDPALNSKIKDVLMLADKAIQGIRDVAANLRPPALDMGLVPALAWLCDQFPNRASAQCLLHIIDEPLELDDARTVAIFRIVQESLTNAARYADAKNVEVTISVAGDNIVVTVRDDGKGFDPALMPSHKSFGLLGMRERAIALGGMVTIASTPFKGTAVSVLIPIRTEECIL